MASSSRLRFFLSLYFFYSFYLTIAGKLESLYHDCYVNNGNYTTNSTYQANLNHLLKSLTYTIPTCNGFYHSSYGTTPDKVYASAICRPDMNPKSCRDCVTFATRNLTLLCPNFKMAIGGYDDGSYANCMLRYAFYDYIGVMENAPYFFVYSLSNITGNFKRFNQTRQSLLQRLSEVAAWGPLKYATGEAAVSDTVTVYGLVQCTPDLTESKCKECLIDANKLLPDCCETRQGGRVITPSCSFRYETNKFYKSYSFRYETNKFYKSSIEEPPISSPTPSANTSTHEGKKKYIFISTSVAN